MVAPCLHHVLVTTSDVERSRVFYRDVLELREIARPPFKFGGAWFQFGGGQHLHLRLVDATDMNKPFDTTDVHFALGMTSYNKTLAWLQGKGFSEELSADNPMKMVLRRNSIVGKPQIYIMDPDRNIIEFICDAVE